MTDEQIVEIKPRMRLNDRANSRLVISGIILALFWGAIIFEYWPDLASAVMRLFNSARSVGAETVQSQYFEVLNNSNATDAQVRSVVSKLETQYKAIIQYLEITPTKKVQVLIVNGSGFAWMDGSQLLISYQDGHMDIALAPIYLVLLAEEMPINMSDGLAPAGGHALQVIEAAGLGDSLLRQPLDDWAVLFRKEGTYLPLEEAWKTNMPDDEDGASILAHAMLESGSFMRWFTAQYGLDSAMRLAQGEDAESVSGQSLLEMEQQWLKSLDDQHIQPKSCQKAIPAGSLFRIICKTP